MSCVSVKTKQSKESILQTAIHNLQQAAKRLNLNPAIHTKILKERSILVIPDILCNAGGVFVSYLEYTQETQREQMTLAEVEQRLAERMKQRLNEVYNLAKTKNLTMRQVAMDLAVSRVVQAILTRGLLP